MKTRLDILLVERGYAPGRDKAKAYIMAGNVFVDGERIDKPGAAIDPNAEIICHGAEPFVSRGGKKLEKAVKSFGLDLTGKYCADIGASTGGFTDCMLQNGAARVYAVDVGYGQLAWSLRNDTRVVNLERTNARYINAEQIPEKLDFFSMDVSFISIKLVLPALVSLLSADAQAVCLIKPQFEVGREQVGKNGVVRDADVHCQVIQDLFCFVQKMGFSVLGLTYSPIKGPKGNIEFLLWMCPAQVETPRIIIGDIVEAAHRELYEECR